MTTRPTDVPGFAHKTTTPSPIDRQGRRESEVGDGDRPTYGEPKGPKPPRFTTAPRAAIDERARRHEEAPGDGEAPAGSRLEGERIRDGYHSGMTTRESLETTGDQPPARVGTDPETDDER